MGKSEEIKSRPPAIVSSKVLVQGVVGLVSLPEVCIRISEMVDDPKSSATQMGRVISKDAAFTARLLRIVNSAFYQYPSRIETVTRAIAIVGHKDLRDLELAATVSGIFERIASDLIDIDYFWRHGVYTGILSRIIAKKCRVLHSERLFIAGLLHDIGKLIVCYKLPKYARQAIELSQQEGIPIHRAEARVLGYNHADVGAQLMAVWGFPESHQVTARYHHEPLMAHTHSLETAIIYLADRISHLAEQGEYEAKALADVPSAIWKITNVSAERLEPILLEARDQFIEALQLFRPRGSQSSHHAA